MKIAAVGKYYYSFNRLADASITYLYDLLQLQTRPWDTFFLRDDKLFSLSVVKEDFCTKITNRQLGSYRFIKLFTTSISLSTILI